MHNSIFADFALIKAHKTDELGNCIFNQTAANNNPDMATASECTICEAEEVVKPGELDPESILLQSIFVHHVVIGKEYKKLSVSY